MKKTIISIALLIFSLKSNCQIDQSKFSDMQKEFYRKVIYENVGGFALSGYKLIYTSNPDPDSYKSIKAKRWTLVPGVTIPTLLGGTFSDENHFGIQLSPLVGLGFSFRKETLTAKTNDLEDGFDKNYSFSFEPLFLLAKYDVEKNRFLPIIGFSINLFKDFFQIGYGYATRSIPGYMYNNYVFLGTNLKLEGIFPEKKVAGTSIKAE